MAGGLVLVTVPGRWLLPGQAGSATRLGTLSPSLQLFLSLCHPPVHFTARLSPTGQKDQISGSLEPRAWNALCSWGGVAVGEHVFGWVN